MEIGLGDLEHKLLEDISVLEDLVLILVLVEIGLGAGTVYSDGYDWAEYGS